MLLELEAAREVTVMLELEAARVLPRALRQSGSRVVKSETISLMLLWHEYQTALRGMHVGL